MNPRHSGLDLTPARRLIGAIFLFGFALRIFLPTAAYLTTKDSAQFEVPDTSSYVQPAISLIEEGRYYSFGKPEIYRPPGYPILLTAGIALGNLHAIAILIQSILGALTCYLVYKCGLLVFRNQTAAVMGAFLCACEPLLILYPSYIQADALLALLVALICFCLLRYLERPSAARLILLALSVAAAAYVKVIAYYLPAWIALGLGIRLLRSQDRKLATQHLVLFLVVTGVMLGSWQVRNHHVAGYFGFSTQIDRAYYFVLGGAVRGTEAGLSQFETRERLEKEFFEIASEDVSNPSSLYSSARHQGLSEAMKHPLTTSWVLTRGFILTLFEPGTGRFLRLFKAPPTGLAEVARNQGYWEAIRQIGHLKPVALFTLITLETVLLLYLALGTLGGIRALRENKWAGLAVCLLGFYFLALASSQGLHRFRVPVMPLVSMFAGGGLFLIKTQVGMWVRPASRNPG